MNNEELSNSKRAACASANEARRKHICAKAVYKAARDTALMNGVELETANEIGRAAEEAGRIFGCW